MRRPSFQLRRPTEAQRRRGRAMWVIFGLFVVALALASLPGAPDGLQSAILAGMPIDGSSPGRS